MGGEDAATPGDEEPATPGGAMTPISRPRRLMAKEADGKRSMTPVRAPTGEGAKRIAMAKTLSMTGPSGGSDGITGAVSSVAPDVESGEALKKKAKMPKTRTEAVEAVRKGLTALLNTYWFNMLTATVTTFALFGEDCRILGFSGSGDADLIFSSLNLTVFSIFMFEICGLIFTKPDYWLGFYFWLDLVSTASMIFDIRWFSKDLSGGSAKEVARTGRVSKGAKSGRVVRLARIVRLVRIVKLFKIKKQLEEGEEEVEEEQTKRQPSKVAKKLTELTTRRVIILLLLMVALFPVFDETSPQKAMGLNKANQFREQGLLNLHKLGRGRRPIVEPGTNATTYGAWNESGSDYCRRTVDLFCQELRHWTRYAGKVRYLKINDEHYDDWLAELYFHHQGKGELNPEPGAPRKKQRPNKKRKQGTRESDKRGYGKRNKQCEGQPCVHKQRWNPRHDLTRSFTTLKKKYGWRFSTDLDIHASDRDSGPRGESLAIVDQTALVEFESLLNLLRMIVIMVVLVSAVIIFTQDATVLVVEPIERMMTLVQRLAENPLGDLKNKKEKEAVVANLDPSDETYLLEQTLAKISGLLQVGFGVAGAEIISKSMQVDAQSDDGQMNYMLPGKRITAVFGFAIIEDFTVTCGCLEAEICLYINTVAKIVHEGAHAFHGAPNKNIGCAFLMVWKICDGVLPGIRDLRDKEPPPNTPEFRQWRTAQRATIAVSSKSLGKHPRDVPPLEMVESAMSSFLKVQVDLHAANRHRGALHYFNKHPAILETFGEEYRVHMGFGLHIGWAIEGSIGSRFKIDASYLSPNVNTAARLEAATHMYSCPLLMSGFFVDEMSPAARSFCRMIDCVSVKGSNVPLELWTFDITNHPDQSLVPTIKANVQQPVDYQTDMYYRELQKGVDPLFMQSFNDAVQEYVAGDWAQAKSFLLDSLKRNPEDGPSKILMRVCAASDFQSPKDWKGFRALTSKT